ncbi:MAG: glycoside-pentoside-hexuronide (GPH):cation symporter [Candidatus Pristimantibacillus lignocellulolyticus]|uniref:Glycoside-pentoside-hexuronide (GPH):cation symporter n=1 Tax=Candidatus Pristimantibacillus lignocellulolyticus TaxID=2994561 RepID=A0A9J6ZIN8_9BACL|nr:MAG: glycoside-pentoside-hexuronide (GPH):cation symporter [Candidatus Pristimantibacillus lignocellulolyticus]
MSQPGISTGNQVSHEQVVINRKFGLRDKLGYMFGDLGNDFFFILVSSFLMVYYTDIFNISAATVGILFLIARIWDAVADVTWGRFIDSRRATKHGKFKPWIFRMSFPLVLSGVLMFVHIPGMSNNFYLIYAFVTYLIWGTLYSTVNIPYGSMASVITEDPVERTALSTFRTMGAMIAGMLIGVVGPLVLFVDNEANSNRFLIAAIIFGIMSLASYMACYKMSTERNVPAADAAIVKTKLSTTLKGLMKNKPLISILSVSLIFMMLNMLLSAVNVYLFKNYFSNASALSIAGLVQVVSILIAVPLTKPLVKRLGKKETASIGMVLAAIVYLTLFFLPDLSAINFILISSIGAFGFGFFNIVVWAFVTDVIDYHEYLTGLREDGTVYSVYSFARKVGQAIAGGIGGFAIQAVGYESGKAVQTDQALHGIFTLSTLVPAIVFTILFFLLVFTYPLNKQKTNQLVTDLANRRSKN